MLTSHEFLLAGIFCVVGLGFLVAALWEWISTVLRPRSAVRQATGIVFCLLLVTMAVWACVGFISTKRHEFIANEDVQARELERRYLPEVVVEYRQERFYVHNMGKTSINLWGTKLGDGPRAVEVEPRIIPPLAHYWMAADQIQKEIMAKVPTGTEAHSILWLYLENQRGQRYIAKVRLWILVVGHSVAINTQMVSLRQGQW